MSVPRLVRTGVVVGCGALAGRAIWQRLASSDGPDPVSGSVYRDSLGWRLYDGVAAAADRRVGWDKLPTPLGLAALIGLRNILRQENLYDTSGEPAVNTPPVPPLQPEFLVTRSEQGVYNDLGRPSMGMAGSRFGRNVPLAATTREPDDLLMPRPEPAPRQPRAPDAQRVPAGDDAQPARGRVDPVHDPRLVQPRHRRHGPLGRSSSSPTTRGRSPR